MSKDASTAEPTLVPASGSPVTELIVKSWLQLTSLFPRFLGLAATIWAVFYLVDLGIAVLLGRPREDAINGFVAAMIVVSALRGIAVAVVQGAAAVEVESIIFEQPLSAFEALAVVRKGIWALVGYGLIIGLVDGLLGFPQFQRTLEDSMHGTPGSIGMAEVFLGWVLYPIVSFALLLTVSLGPAASTIEGGPMGYGFQRSLGLLSGRRLKLIAGALCTGGVVIAIQIMLDRLTTNPDIETIRRLLMTLWTVLGSLPLPIFLAVLYQDSDAAERGMLRPEWLPEAGAAVVAEPVIEEPVVAAKPAAEKAPVEVAKTAGPATPRPDLKAAGPPTPRPDLKASGPPTPRPDLGGSGPVTPRPDVLNKGGKKVWDISADTMEAPKSVSGIKKPEPPKPGPAKPEPAKVETKPEPEVETKPEPEVEAKSEPKVEAKPEPKVETKPEPEVEAKPEPKVEAKPEPKVEAKPEPEVEAKPAPEPKAEEKVEPVKIEPFRPELKADDSADKPAAQAARQPIIERAMETAALTAENLDKIPEVAPLETITRAEPEAPKVEPAAPANAETATVEEAKPAPAVEEVKPAPQPVPKAEPEPKRKTVDDSAVTQGLSLQHRLAARAASRKRPYQDPPTQKLTEEQSARAQAASRKDATHRRASDTSDGDPVPVKAPSPAAWERIIEEPPDLPTAASRDNGPERRHSTEAVE